MSLRIGLFYGSSTCYTEMAGEKIRDHINGMFGANVVTMHNIASDPISLMTDYSYLILGIPTWVYGLGDQIGYPEWFQDALGYLWAKVVNQGATTVGAWPNQGYTFEQSKALTEDEKFFVGLPLDDENQLDLTEDFIRQWCEQIVMEFGLGSK